MDPTRQGQSEPLRRFSALTITQLAHELRQFLAVMSRCAGALGRRPGPDLDDHDLRGLSEAIDRAFRITDELLALANPHALERSVVDVNEVILQARDMLGRLLDARSRLTIDLRARAPIVTTHAIQLEWVLLNLVANARDAMPEGGVLSIGTEDVQGHESAPARRYVRLVVSHTGTAIVDAPGRRPFLPLSRASAAGDAALSSVTATVQTIGGVLSIENEPEGSTGTRMVVMLPLVEPVTEEDRA